MLLFSFLDMIRPLIGKVGKGTVFLLLWGWFKDYISLFRGLLTKMIFGRRGDWVGT